MELTMIHPSTQSPVAATNDTNQNTPQTQLHETGIWERRPPITVFHPSSVAKRWKTYSSFKMLMYEG
jgi:hypothetical protein